MQIDMGTLMGGEANDRLKSTKEKAAMSHETEEQKLYHKALIAWGINSQVLTCIAECGELIAALPQYFFRGRLDAATVAAQVADVEIMCGQMRVLLGEGLVDLAKAEKLSRLANSLHWQERANGR